VNRKPSEQRSNFTDCSYGFLDGLLATSVSADPPFLSRKATVEPASGISLIAPSGPFKTSPAQDFKVSHPPLPIGTAFDMCFTGLVNL
jgi:hypothetical protein